MIETGNRKIARNTLMLYLRMVLSTIVGLYTSRVVLLTLGVEDYGIIGVVGGIVSILSFLNVSLSGSTSRFITIDLGLGDRDRLRSTFNAAFQSHLLIGFLVVLFLETVGLWVLTHHLVIPIERICAAHWVYQLSILSVLIGFTQVPYTSLVMAHEQMEVYAWLEILSVLLRLLVVWILQTVASDRLVLYALLTFSVTLLVQCLYRWYCHQHYAESHLSFSLQPVIMRQILSFSGLSLFSDASDTVRQQGITIMLNRFFGLVVNASCGLALMVQGAFWSCGYHVLAAFRPQIVKQYACGNYASMQKLLGHALQYTVLLLAVVTVPALYCMPTLMRLWLGQVPDYVVVLSQILLVDNFFGLINHILYTAIQTRGEIRAFCLINGTCKFLCLPCIFFLLRSFPHPAVPFLFDIAVLLVLIVVNLKLLKVHLPQLSVRALLRSLFVALGLIAASCFILFPFSAMSAGRVAYMFLLGVLNFLLLVLGSYYIVLSPVTRYHLRHRFTCRH